MNPVRKRFFGDAVVAQRYTGEALVLLSAVHDQKRLGGIGYHTLSKTLANGVELTAISAEGHDEVHVRVNAPKPAPSDVSPREFCVWEGDSEIFTEPMFGYNITGPTSFDKDNFYMGGTLTAVDVPPTEYTHGKRKFSSVDGSEIENSEVQSVPGATIPIANSEFLVVFADSVAKDVYGIPISVQDVASFDLAGRYARGSAPSVVGVFDTSSGDQLGSVSTIGAGATMIHAPSGDIYFGMHSIGSDFPLATESEIRRLGIETGVYKTYQLPSVIPRKNVLARYDFVVTKSQDIWLCYGQGEFDVHGHVVYQPWRVFRMTEATERWVEVTASGGFGNPGRGGERFNSSRNHSSWVNTIMHDPITDAVCMMRVDQGWDFDSGSTENEMNIRGAWIFNGKDCLGKELAPFFRRFETVPVEPIVEGFEPGNYSLVESTQFYNARIYLRYTTLATDPNTTNLYHWNSVGAAYKVGKLLQTRG